ncbi:VOC family protein [Algibacter sp.]|uniref:VOC family protein n=1 Tax=Algibacter sp. TaxID=1872428 RepID=UPI003C754EB8
METSFHMSLPCLSIKETKKFYTTIGATFGRATEYWIDANLYGHQMTFIKSGKFNFNSPNYVFEGKILPSFHFGIILDPETWKTIYAKLKAEKLELVSESQFLSGKVGEHNSFFVKDPNDYMLEFKTFKDANDMFKS